MRSIRRTFHSTFHRRIRSTIRTRWRAPDDLGEALTAFRRAIITHRQLARLAPQFFDAAWIQREQENRAEERRWMQLCESSIAQAYGVDPQSPAPENRSPPLPHPNTQHAVDHRLDLLQVFLKSGADAMERHRQRHPHACPSLSRVVRMYEIAFDLKRLVLGLDSTRKLPDKITYDLDLARLKRAYGHSGTDIPACGVTAQSCLVPGNPDTDCAKPFELPTPAPSEKTAPVPLPSESVLPPVGSPARCDAWSRWARQRRLG